MGSSREAGALRTEFALNLAHRDVTGHSAVARGESRADTGGLPRGLVGDVVTRDAAAGDEDPLHIARRRHRKGMS